MGVPSTARRDTGTSQHSETGTGLGPPAPPAATDTCHVPSSPSPWLSHNIYSTPGNLAGATALPREPVTPLCPPSFMFVPTGAPPKLSLCPLSASVPVVTSRAWIPSPHLLSATECSSKSLGGQQDVPSCHHPPPRDSQRHKLLWTEGTVGLGKEVLSPGRKF